jgi:glycosyltransferase involved in cell wall biosynthesis
MSRFPHLPETFILREMSELERQGWHIGLYPLIRQQQPVLHAEAKEWLARAHFVRSGSASAIGANLQALSHKPRVFLAAWGRAMRDNARNPGFLARATLLLPKATAMARLMQEQGIAHIHAHYATHPALVAWMIHRLSGITFSFTVHAHDIYERTEMLTTKVREAAFVAAISTYNRELVVRIAGEWARARTYVVHCGIVPEDYQVAAGVGLRETGGRFEIISVGSLQPYKGQRYLVEACALLRDRGIPVHCRIVGGGQEYDRLEQQIRKSGLDGSVELLGALPQESVARLLPTAHCYAQPSIITRSGKMEGIPVSLMEALACCLPVIATEISGVPELVRRNETGYLVPPADVSALADALGTVYAQPREAAALARAGRALVLREFDLRTNVAALASLFERVTAHSRTGQLTTTGGRN